MCASRLCFVETYYSIKNPMLGCLGLPAKHQLSIFPSSLLVLSLSFLFLRKMGNSGDSRHFLCLKWISPFMSILCGLYVLLFYPSKISIYPVSGIWGWNVRSFERADRHYRVFLLLLFCFFFLNRDHLLAEYHMPATLLGTFPDIISFNVQNHPMRKWGFPSSSQCF